MRQSMVLDQSTRSWAVKRRRCPWAVVVPADPDLSMLRVIFNRRRQESGLTFDELAARSGVARQTLLNVSSGRYRGDLLTWLRLSKAFGVGLDELLEPVWDDGHAAGEC